MTVRLSSGLAASMLGNYGLRAMMNYGYIALYDGIQPVSPDIPPDGTLLGLITTGGDAFLVNSFTDGALEISQSSNGVIGKVGAWILSGEATGVATYWRWYWNAFDNTDFSIFYPRMDGAIGESLVLADANITGSTSVEIESFNVQFRG
jgi:hypothetical protein